MYFRQAVFAVSILFVPCFGMADNAASTIDSTFIQTTAPTDRDSALVDHALSAFSVGYVLYTADSIQYVGYYDVNHQMTIAQRTLPSGPWAYVKLDEFISWDSHNYITMAKDKRGILHVSGNLHVKPLKFFSTDQSGDISTLKRVESLVGRDETKVTYPSFMSLPDGNLLFHYRSGSSGNGNEIYDILDDEGNWHRFLDTPLTDGRGLSNAYMLGPVFLSDGNYHLVWVWRDTPDCATNHDISYAYSPDMKHWYSADGESATLPISPSDSCFIVDPVPVKGGTLNGEQGITIDSEGRPLISYFKYDENGNSQIYLARYEGSKGWNISKLSSWQWRWDFSGGGSISNKINVHAPVVHHDGCISVVYQRMPSPGETISGRLWADPLTLKFICETDVPAPVKRYGEWVDEISLPYADPDVLMLHKVNDSGGAGYMLRWESLGRFNDRKPDVELPPAAELRVIRFRNDE